MNAVTAGYFASTRDCSEETGAMPPRSMTNPISRRELLRYGMAATTSAALASLATGQDKKEAHQRVVVIMFDGFGPAYFAESKMPAMQQWKRDGIHKLVTGVMPSVTNANNASICCG